MRTLPKRKWFALGALFSIAALGAVYVALVLSAGGSESVTIENYERINEGTMAKEEVDAMLGPPARIEIGKDSNGRYETRFYVGKPNIYRRLVIEVSWRDDQAQGSSLGGELTMPGKIRNWLSEKMGF